jgi:TRAP-type mannitol/chloroaromatic compound transport system permease small subunit
LTVAAWPRSLDRALGVIATAAAWLALPMSLLLFLQWPLREFVARYSREANDAAQILFALFVSVALTYATRRGSHVATDVLAARYSARVRGVIARIGAACVLLPWSGFIVFTAWSSTAQSVLQLEGFPETFNPGYFLIRIALLTLAALVFAQALVDVVRPAGNSRR